MHHSTLHDLSRGQENRLQWLKDKFGDMLIQVDRPQKHRYFYFIGNNIEKKDMLKMLQGAAASTNNVYAAQGANAVGLLDNLLGGSLWGTYRYAANSGQFMNDSAGRWIMIWTFLLMVAPAICVLAQFFREPYSRRAMLVGSGISTVLFILTPTLIHQWANQFAINHQINTAQIGQMFSVGYMAYFGMGCSIMVFVIAIIRSIKRDKF